MFSTSWVSSWLCLELDLPDSCFCLQPHIPWARCKKLWFSLVQERGFFCCLFVIRSQFPTWVDPVLSDTVTGFSVSLSLKTDPPSLCKIRRTPFSALIKCEYMAKRLKVYRCIFDRRYDPEQVSSRLFSPVFYKVKVVESAGPQIHWSPRINCGHQAVLWHYNGCELREWAISPQLSCRLGSVSFVLCWLLEDVAKLILWLIMQTHHVTPAGKPWGTEGI